MKTNLSKLSLVIVSLLFGMNSIAQQADINLTLVDTDTNDVTITNLGNAAQDVSSYWVCLGPSRYRQLSTLTITTGDYNLAPNEAVTFNYPLIANEVDEAGLGLFSTNGFGSTDSTIFIDYIQWGNTDQDRAQQAVDAGIWSDADDFVSCPAPYSVMGLGGNPIAWGEADGGTVSIDAATDIANGTTVINNDNSASILVGDGIPNPIIVAHLNPEVSPDRSYRYVITDAETGLILNVVPSNTIDLDVVAPGTCEIWGWSYSGVPGNGLNQVGQPLSVLNDLDCSDISDNQVTVVRVDDLDTLSVNDNILDGLEISIFPNPTSDQLTIDAETLKGGYEVIIYSISGQQVFNQLYSKSVNTINVSSMSNGVYIMSILDKTSGKNHIEQFIKR